MCLSLSSPEVHWAGYDPSCPRPDTEVSRVVGENLVFVYKLIYYMLIWRSLLPTPKWFRIDQYRLISTTLPVGMFSCTCIKSSWASWIMKEESSLFYWFNGSGPSSGLLTGSQNTKAPKHTHAFSHKQIHTLCRHNANNFSSFSSWGPFQFIF